MVEIVLSVKMVFNFYIDFSISNISVKWTSPIKKTLRNDDAFD